MYPGGTCMSVPTVMAVHPVSQTFHLEPQMSPLCWHFKSQILGQSIQYPKWWPDLLTCQQPECVPRATQLAGPGTGQDITTFKWARLLYNRTYAQSKGLISNLHVCQSEVGFWNCEIAIGQHSDGRWETYYIFPGPALAACMGNLPGRLSAESTISICQPLTGSIASGAACTAKNYHFDKLRGLML